MGIFSMDDLDMGPPPPQRCYVCKRKGTKKRPLTRKREDLEPAHEECQKTADLIWERAHRFGKLAQRVESGQPARPGMREYIDAVKREFQPYAYRVGQTISITIGDVSGHFTIVGVDPDTGSIDVEPVQAEVHELIGHDVDQTAWDGHLKRLGVDPNEEEEA